MNYSQPSSPLVTIYYVTLCNIVTIIARRLMSERSVIEEELAKMREQARLRQQQVIVQCKY